MNEICLEIQESEYSFFDLEDETHVWVVTTSRPQSELQYYLKNLDDDELKRYHSYYFLKDKIRYLVSRGFIKDLLAKYLDVDPDVISICRSRYGKPYLDKSLNEYGIQFSLAHSHDILVIAIARNRRVGIDIEYIHKKVDYLKVASHFFTEREKMTLESLSDSQRRSAFYNYWTRKEALLKAVGDEPPMDFLDVEASIRLGETVRINKFKDGYWDISRWIVIPLFPLEEYIGTLVIEKSPHAF